VYNSGANSVKLETAQHAVALPTRKCWIIPAGIEDVDQSWHPNPFDPPMTYHFGTQWQRTGGAVYQKIHGRKPPLQFIDPGYDLFNNVERVDISVDDNGEIWETPIYSKGFHEDGWFVQRDLDGFLISYLELQDGEGKYFMYDKDGERIL
jgi:hypothetical protein